MAVKKCFVMNLQNQHSWVWDHATLLALLETVTVLPDPKLGDIELPGPGHSAYEPSLLVFRDSLALSLC